MKKIFTLALALFMLVFAVSGLAQQAPVSLMGYEPTDSNRNWADNLFFERMAQKTGLQFAFFQFSDLQAYHARLDAFTKGDKELPEVLFKAALDPVRAGRLLEKGLLVDLAPYLEEHAPNFYQLMQQRPELARAISLKGGAIPALPYVAQQPGQNILWINKAWLAELKLDTPRNFAELESVLQAFKEKDPNRNGRRDETPLSFIGPYDLKYLAHAWGLAANDFNIFVEGGKVQFLPQQPGFSDFVQGLARLYAQGLLDREGFSTVDALRRVSDAKASNRFGAFFAPLPTMVVPIDWTSQYQALLPLEFNGNTVYRAVASPVFYGTFALTTACRDIPKMLAFVDHLYTPQGAILAQVGLDGEDYVTDGDGSWRLIREGGDRSYFSRVIIASDQSAPGLSTEDFQRSYSDPVVRALTEQTAAVAQTSVLPFPHLPINAEQAARLAPLQAALGQYVDESIARFTLGEWQVNQERLDAFRQHLKTLGVEEFIALWQQIYDEGMAQNGV